MKETLHLEELTRRLLHPPGGEKGTLAFLYGPYEARKLEVSLGLAFSLAREGFRVHYFDLNLSLRPEDLLSFMEEGKEDLPLFIYRPSPLEMEKVIDLLASQTGPRGDVVIINSLIFIAGRSYIRDERIDPLYLFSLLKRFLSKPKNIALVILETRVKDITGFYGVVDILDRIDLLMRISPGREDIPITLYNPPFKEGEHLYLQLER